MRIIRVSEITSFIFCQRAWWYQRQGIEPINRAELAGGSLFHVEQARGVKTAVVFQVIAWCLIILATLVLAIASTSLFFR